MQTHEQRVRSPQPPVEQRQLEEPPSGAKWRLAPADMVAGGLLALFAFSLSIILSGLIVPNLVDGTTVDLWFEGDVDRVIRNMTQRWSDHTRTEAHPLFSLVAYSPVFALALLGIPELLAVRIVVALGAVATTLLIYAALRVLDAKPVNAGLISVLSLVAAGGMFWQVVPETHVMAGATVAMAVLVAAVKCRRDVPEWTDVVISSATLSMTVTNWAVGILATIPRRTVSRSAMLSLSALGLVSAAWAIEKKVFVTPAYFLGKGFEAESVLAPESGGPIGVAGSFFFHSVVMPAIQVVDRPSSGTWPIMIVQPSAPGSTGILGLICVVLWAILLVLGVRALLSDDSRRPLGFVLIGGLTSQLTICTLFGNETFLYVGNFLPLLIVLAGVGVIGPQARTSVVIAILLTGALLVNNGRQLSRAIAFFDDFAPMSSDPVDEMEARPQDPWPRAEEPSWMSAGPVRVFDRATHSLGGSFSPALTTFGLSLWVLDGDSLLATSSGLDPSQIVQTGTPPPYETAEHIETETPFYRTTWTATGLREWRLDLVDVEDGYPLALIVRRVGPRGGPVRVIGAQGGAFTVNERWNVAVDPLPLGIGVGVEGGPDWTTSPTRTTAEDLAGWGFGRAELGDGGTWSVTVHDTRIEDGIDRLLAVLR